MTSPSSSQLPAPCDVAERNAASTSLNIRPFLSKILPTSGWYILATPNGNGHFRHHVKRSIGEIAELAAQSDEKGNTVYHACASFEHVFIELRQPGGTPKRVQRVQDNVKYLRSLWLDLDIGTDNPKKYPDQRAALVALGDFLTATGLPPPMIVSSGYGLHLYWPLTDNVTPDQWLPATHALKALCTAHGFKADPMRTTDHASVLRPVGTHNRKDPANPKPVALLQDAEPTPFPWLRNSLERATKQANVTPTQPRGYTAPSDVERANAQFLLPVEHVPSSAHLVADQCAQVRLMRDSRGCIPEPQWYAAIGVLVHTEEGEPPIHEWSNGYSGYSEAETNRKIAQVKAFGPTTCAKFGQVNPAGCKGCVHGGQITSPIQLGHKSHAQQPARQDPAPSRALEWLPATPPGASAALPLAAPFLTDPEPTYAPLFDLPSARVGRFLDTAPPARRYLLKDCLPCGKVGMIVAPGGTGKSQFVLQLAVAVATGTPLAGVWEVGESGAVLGLFAEDDSEELHRRISGTAQALDTALRPCDWREQASDRLYIRSMVGFDNLMTDIKPNGGEVARTECHGSA